MKSGSTTAAPVLDRRLRRNAIGFREVLSIAGQWQLTSMELCILLGTSVRTLQRWKIKVEPGAGLNVSETTVERLSYLIGIDQALRTLFPTPSNRVLWIRGSNQGEAFNGQSPLERMLTGRVADLHLVRAGLDAAQN